MTNRRLPLTALVAGLVGAIVAANVWGAVSNHPSSSTGTNTVNSAALFCAGLTNGSGGASGVVTFTNTSTTSRTVAITVAATGATAGPVSSTLVIPAGEHRSIAPVSVLHGSTYAVAAQVDGGGVLAQEIVSRDHAEVPCTTSGVTNWFASGFDTLVGDKATITLFNPSATAAVINVSTYSANGFNAPAPLQGITVGPRSVSTVNLGGQIVNTSDIGVHIAVLRGALAIVGDQVEGSVPSIVSGTTSLVTAAQFPLVTTATDAVAQIRLANPGALPATVTLGVSLGTYKVPNQSVTVPANGSVEAVITPNTAIPAGGEASITVSSTEPVMAGLAMGTDKGVMLSSVAQPSALVTLVDAAGSGFANAVVSNTSSRSVRIVVSVLAGGATTPTTTDVTLQPKQITPLVGLVNGLGTLSKTIVTMQAPQPVLLITATLPTKPSGQVLAAVLNGR